MSNTVGTEDHPFRGTTDPDFDGLGRTNGTDTNPFHLPDDFDYPTTEDPAEIDPGTQGTAESPFLFEMGGVIVASAFSDGFSNGFGS
jgi:hypothetical protein